MDVSRAALVVIDMQNESQYGIQGMHDAVQAARLLTHACRAAGMPIIYTRQVNREDSIGLPNSEPRNGDGLPVHYRANSRAVEIVPDLTPQPHDIVIDKHRWSGFHGTSLDLVLRDLGIQHLVMAGFVTDGCLLTSVFDAYAHDYQVNLIKDACAATNDGAHKAAILMMANWVYDIEIFSAEQFAKKLDGAEHASWKPSGPDQMQFAGDTLDAVFASLG